MRVNPGHLGKVATHPPPVAPVVLAGAFLFLASVDCESPEAEFLERTPAFQPVMRCMGVLCEVRMP